MVLGPFLAVLIIFIGITLAAVGNRLLLVGGDSESAERHRNMGVGIMSFGIFVVAFVFIMDFDSMSQVGPSVQNWFRGLVTTFGL